MNPPRLRQCMTQRRGLWQKLMKSRWFRRNSATWTLV